jgi:hypothetical protein
MQCILPPPDRVPSPLADASDHSRATDLSFAKGRAPHRTLAPRFAKRREPNEKDA